MEIDMKLIDVIKVIPLKSKVSICEVKSWSLAQEVPKLFHINGKVETITPLIKAYKNYSVTSIESFINIEDDESIIMISIKGE